MLKRIIVALVLLLHTYSILLTIQPDEFAPSAISGKILESNPPVDSDYYLYSSSVPLIKPGVPAISDHAGGYVEEMNCHSYFNIISPPPEGETL